MWSCAAWLRYQHDHGHDANEASYHAKNEEQACTGAEQDVLPIHKNREEEDQNYNYNYKGSELHFGCPLSMPAAIIRSRACSVRIGEHVCTVEHLMNVQQSDLDGLARLGTAAHAAGREYWDNPMFFSNVPTDTAGQLLAWVDLCGAWAAGWLEADAGRTKGWRGC